MNYTQTSAFPTSVDPLIYYSDLKRNQVSEMQNYGSLCSESKFTEANAFFKTSTIHGVNAALINAAIARIYKLQVYLKTKSTINNKIITQDSEPVTAVVGCNWLSSE